MINRKFIDHIGDKLGIQRRDLIEKDILLQMILNELLKNKDFKENFAFKGGTCLIKCYFFLFNFHHSIISPKKKLPIINIFRDITLIFS